MQQSIASVIACVLVSVLLSACSSPQAIPVNKPMKVNGEVQSPNHIHAAKGFLHNIGAGQAFNVGILRALAIRGLDEPGLAELANRAFADVDEDELEYLLAGVYARHLSYSQLVELEKLSANEGVHRFFSMLYEAEFAGKPTDDEILMRQMNADELTQIMILAHSDAFKALGEVQEEINLEMYEVGGVWAEETMRRYIDEQRTRVLNEAPTDIQSREMMPATPARTL